PSQVRYQAAPQPDSLFTILFSRFPLNTRITIPGFQPPRKPESPFLEKILKIFFCRFSAQDPARGGPAQQHGIKQTPRY
ncbi:hypothetical protein, partial [Rothia mucilaginosa]|uniref:hypothetical protein n=1 Tax=Rothia mucilaginosa TaxID=43675 RepID=UPI0026ED6E2D